MFIVFHDLSLFISVRAFLPSLRVLNTSHVKDEIIRIVSVIRETRVVSILLVNLKGFLQSLKFKLKKIQTLDLEYAGISIPPS